MINQKPNDRNEKGRAAQYNPQSRFTNTAYIQEHSEGMDDWEQEPRKTEYIFDQSKTIVNEVKGKRMSGDGKIAELIRTQFMLYCKKYKLNETKHEWNLTSFRRMNNRQASLFE